ncbi:MAG TPA: nuclear transport factor 2 family protein [Acidobacteriota bacterium]
MDEPEHDPELEQVLAANRRFYAAFGALSVEQMSEVWLHEDWVQCVHPGWQQLQGWDEVRESWARIFGNTQRIQLEIASVSAHAEGEVAWVACVETVLSTFERGFDHSQVQATNIFVRRDGAWQMVSHHASPLPPPEEPTLQ